MAAHRAGHTWHGAPHAGRECQWVVSSATTSVTRDIVAADTFDPWISSRWEPLSQVPIPQASSDEIMSSTLPSRRAHLGAIIGSKEPLRSRGTVICTGPWRVCTVLVVFPLREMPAPSPAGSLDVPLGHSLRLAALCDVGCAA